MSAPDLDERLRAIEPHLLLFAASRMGRTLERTTEPSDVVQEVYLRLIASQLPAFVEGDRDLRRLARTVCEHVLIDLVRARRAAKRDSSAAPAASRWPTRVDGAAGPRTLAQIRETERDWVCAFRSLTPEHRRVLRLREFEGLSARETATRMGRGESAVHSLFRRALEAWEAARKDLRA